MTPTEINNLAEQWTDLCSKIDDMINAVDSDTNRREHKVLEYMLAEIESATRIGKWL